MNIKLQVIPTANRKLLNFNQVHPLEKLIFLIKGSHEHKLWHHNITQLVRQVDYVFLDLL